MLSLQRKHIISDLINTDFSDLTPQVKGTNLAVTPSTYLQMFLIRSGEFDLDISCYKKEQLPCVPGH